MPPELIFDAGFGELFIVRVAGNVISPEVMGTLQYAGVHLRTPLFVVLGHEGCGAVMRRLPRGTDAGAGPHRAGYSTTSFRACAISRLNWLLTQRCDAAVEANVRWSMHQLLETPEAKARLVEGTMKLVGCVYELESGRVRFLP